MTESFPLNEYVQGQIWLKEYPIHYAGCDFLARMTVIRSADSNLMLHSPCHIDAATKQEIEALGTVKWIVAPGTYHYFHVASAQDAFPEAETYICPGIEQKVPSIKFDWILGDTAPSAWSGMMEQVLIRGSKFIWEIAFFHKPSKTLVLVDAIENFTDQTKQVNWILKVWWKLVFHMWNRPKPAPEYQMGWKDKQAAKDSLEKILVWDFKRVIVAHGDNIESEARAVARKAWSAVLKE